VFTALLFAVTWGSRGGSRMCIRTEDLEAVCLEISKISPNPNNRIPRSSNTPFVLEKAVVCHHAHPRPNLSLSAPPSDRKKFRVKPQPGVGLFTSLHFSVRKVAFFAPGTVPHSPCVVRLFLTRRSHLTLRGFPIKAENFPPPFFFSQTLPYHRHL
jgi:hypothetical protein